MATHGLPTETTRSYAAEDFPDFFENPDSTVGSADFMGKITALHAEAHRPEETPTPQYLSRHHHNIAMLLDTEDGKGAALDFELLEQVAKHKAVFFRSSWASYDTGVARDASACAFRNATADLRSDHRGMPPMMFDEKPLSFDKVVSRLREFQETINASSPVLQKPDE
ncbi:hypothetical protein [Mesorhizobium sp. M0491]|uniref:hypothetical protein n=1 Tax=unclassified Mesorhizobium TaxID=325217 RepID=UPI00333B7BDF